MGIGMSIPLFDGFSNTYKIRGAEARWSRGRRTWPTRKTGLPWSWSGLMSMPHTPLRNLDASADLLKAAQEALTVSRRRYEQGRGGHHRNAQTRNRASFVAERERIRCLAEWNSARLKLLASAGEMGRATVQKAVKSQQ